MGLELPKKCQEIGLPLFGLVEVEEDEAPLSLGTRGGKEPGSTLHESAPRSTGESRGPVQDLSRRKTRETMRDLRLVASITRAVILTAGGSQAAV